VSRIRESYDRARQWGGTNIFNEPADAPQGDGLQGALRRFGVGAAQDFLPTRGQAITRGFNPAAYIIPAVAGGLRDAVQGSNWYRSLFNRQPASQPGAPLPGWMQQGAPFGPRPPAPTYSIPQFAEPQPPQQMGDGTGMMRQPGGPPLPQQSPNANRVSGGSSLFAQLRRNPNMSNGGPIGTQSEAISAQGIRALEAAEREYQRRAGMITR
jgi:hypothetical protein